MGNACFRPAYSQELTLEDVWNKNSLIREGETLLQEIPLDRDPIWLIKPNLGDYNGRPEIVERFVSLARWVPSHSTGNTEYINTHPNEKLLRALHAYFGERWTEFKKRYTKWYFDMTTKINTDLGLFARDLRQRLQLGLLISSLGSACPPFIRSLEYERDPVTREPITLAQKLVLLGEKLDQVYENQGLQAPPPPLQQQRRVQPVVLGVPPSRVIVPRIQAAAAGKGSSDKRRAQCE
jgi:hypothetical protein